MLRKRPVENDGHRVGIVPEVAQLVVSVAVVGVHRYQSDLHGGERSLEVLGTVVQVHRNLVLLRHAEIEEELREPVRSTIEVPPGDISAALGDGDHFGLNVGDRLPDVGVVPVRHGLFALIARCLPPSISSPSIIPVTVTFMPDHVGAQPNQGVATPAPTHQSGGPDG